MIEIRNVHLYDAANLIKYLNEVSGETDNLTHTKGELDININEERAFINRLESDELFLVAYDDEKLIGQVSVLKNKKANKLSHNYELAITILKAYHNQGIGTSLMTKVMEFIKEKQIKDLYLNVKEDNLVARHLYEKFNFREVGLYENYLKINDKYYNMLVYKYQEFDKVNLYEEALTIIPSLLEGNHYLSNLANLSTFMWDYMKDINWLGFYLNLDGKLILGPYKGKVACTTINYQNGVCGACYTLDKVMLVKDVHAFPGHIACDSASNSEIVLPIHKNNEVFALLDIDSPYLNRFDEIDQKYLEKIVKLIEKELAK